MTAELAGLVVTVLALAGTTPPDQARANEWAALAGRWVPLRPAKRVHLSDSEQEWEIGTGHVVGRHIPTLSGTGRPKTTKGACRIDPSRTPRAIDITFPEDTPWGRAIRGVYLLQGDILVICAAEEGRPRPDGFTAEPGSGRRFLVLQRARP